MVSLETLFRTLLDAPDRGISLKMTTIDTNPVTPVFALTTTMTIRLVQGNVLQDGRQRPSIQDDPVNNDCYRHGL